MPHDRVKSRVKQVKEQGRKVKQKVDRVKSTAVEAREDLSRVRSDIDEFSQELGIGTERGDGDLEVVDDVGRNMAPVEDALEDGAGDSRADDVDLLSADGDELGFDVDFDGELEF